MKTFYSNGKLLLTAEYLVLDGAKALAVPTIYGQSLEVKNSKKKGIQWTSHDADKSIWYEATFDINDIVEKNTHFDNAITNTLIEILNYANAQNPTILESARGFTITTHLDFPKNWGLGTSSTLINNIAQWFKIDAFALLKNAFGGSGYDIACAQNNSPIIFQLKNGKSIVKPIPFRPSFKKNIFFLYLNQKQNSKTAIANYLSKKNELSKIIPKIDELTATIAITSNFDVFCQALQVHEMELSNILEMPTVHEQLFSDFDGVIKSLGAWGGDFVMAVSKSNPTHYFQNKGYHVVIGYDDLILSK